VLVPFGSYHALHLLDASTLNRVKPLQNRNHAIQLVHIRFPLLNLALIQFDEWLAQPARQWNDEPGRIGHCIHQTRQIDGSASQPDGPLYKPNTKPLSEESDAVLASLVVGIEQEIAES